MWDTLAQSGIATAQLDMTSALAPLGIGLLSLLAISAAMIVWAAVRPQLRQPVAEPTEVEFAPMEQPAAA